MKNDNIVRSIGAKNELEVRKSTVLLYTMVYQAFVSCPTIRSHERMLKSLRQIGVSLSSLTL